MRPKVRHIAVMTKNREKMVDFYQKVFGLEPKRGFGGAIYMSDGDVNIALIEVKREEQKEGINHFGFEVDDLDEAGRKLEAAHGQRLTAKAVSDAELRDGVHANFEQKWSGPDGVVFDVSHTGWEGTHGAD